MRFASTVVLLLSVCSVHFAYAAPKATKEEVNLLSARVERMERVVDAQSADKDNKINKQALISLQNQLKTMERELQALRSQNERLQNDVEQMQARQRDLFLAIDQRVEGQASSDIVEQPAQSQQTETESLANNTSADPDTSADTTVSTETEPGAAVTRPVFDTDNTEDSADTTQAYREAFLLLKQRDYEAATTAFEGFLETYPKSKYSANAQYWMAEANYVTKRYAEALQQFQTVIDQYPTSSKVPDARLKIGYTYYELGQWEEARVTLTRLRAQFPNSTVAGLAQQRLERLEKEGH